MSGQKALVTGATGYVGSRLVEKLIRDGWDVSVILRKNSDRKKLLNSPSLKTFEYDGSAGTMLEIVKKSQPEMVFHLASLVQVDHQPGDIRPLIESNILFGTELLEAMVQNRARFFINIGSYWQHYQGQPYNPVNLYAATKQAFQDILHFYRQADSMGAITLKLFDVYGPKDTRKKIFQQLEEASANGKELAISAGDQLLDLVYIDDVVSAIGHAAKLLRTMPAGSFQESYAVSSLKRTRLKEVVTLYEKVTGKSVPVVWGARPYRLREEMEPWQGTLLPGWEPETDLELGITKMTAYKTDTNVTSKSLR